MKLTIGTKVLDAKFDIEESIQHNCDFDIVVGSAGGGLNPDYDKLLTALFRALSRIEATVEAIRLDSSSNESKKLTDEERTLKLSYPITISKQKDIESFRKLVSQAQKSVGQKAGAKGGNGQKRIRISISNSTAGSKNDFLEMISSDSTSPVRSAFFLVWNPKIWPESKWEDLDVVIAETAGGKTRHGRWSTGSRTSGIQEGDHLFLVRQGKDRGVLAHGFAYGTRKECVYQDDDFHEDSSGLQNYVDIKWTRILSANDRLPMEQLKLEIPNVNWDRIQGSGQSIPYESFLEIDEYWHQHLEALDSDEPWVPPAEDYPEGGKKTSTVTRYERNRKARKVCIAKYGYTCSVCELNFAHFYGDHGIGFIEVHHLTPVSSGKGRSTKVDPIKDLRPVCSNCHSMLHWNRPKDDPLSISELRRLLNKES